MADYCKQCSLETFGKDYKELALLCSPGDATQAICEGCGPQKGVFGILVDHAGRCVDDTCAKHGDPTGRSTVAYKLTLDM